KSTQLFTFSIKAVEGYDLNGIQISTGTEDYDSRLSIKRVTGDSLVVSLGGIITPLEFLITGVIRLSSGNETLPDASGAWASGGQLYIRTPQAGTVYVYAFSGQLYRVVQAAAGDTAVSLPKGEYIVVLDGHTYKVAVR
ncbi:MAG: hypothetical protein LBR86_04820, partial [Tannerella sp.]|nr:hypothetical protein [Tannerella sp.]